MLKTGHKTSVPGLGGPQSPRRRFPCESYCWYAATQTDESAASPGTCPSRSGNITHHLIVPFVIMCISSTRCFTVFSVTLVTTTAPIRKKVLRAHVLIYGVKNCVLLISYMYCVTIFIHWTFIRGDIL